MAIEKKYNISELLKSPKSLPDLAKALDIQKHLRLHTTAHGYNDWWMVRNKYLESERSYEIKKIVCAPTTPRIVEGLKKQFFKIFRAKGRVFNYNLDANTTKDFEAKLQDVCHGLSMDAVMQTLWHDGMFEDPHSLIGVELAPENELKNGEPKPIVTVYPTQKIADICIEGGEIEYVVLHWTVIKAGEEKVAKRVIDKEYDTVYIKEGEEWVINIKEDGKPDTLPNAFGRVPFMQLSTVYRSMFSWIIKNSPISNALPDLKQYLSISDDHYLCVKIHQHPLFYSYPVTCPTCNGAKTVERKSMMVDEVADNNGECGTCYGKGIVPSWKSDITQGISLPVVEAYETNGFPAAPAPAGYVTNDNETLREQRVELEDKENAIEKSVLGVQGLMNTEASAETATKVELNLQPLIDTLSSYSANAEAVRKFLTDLIGKIYYSANWKGCDIFYGRKYFVRSEDNIMRELKLAREAGATVSYLKELQDELTFIRFERNPEALTRAMVINEVEPFNGYTFDEINSFLFINRDDYVIKTNISDFVERFESENGNIVEYVKKAANYKLKLQEIKLKFKEYAKQIETVEPNGGGTGIGTGTGSEDGTKA